MKIIDFMAVNEKLNFLDMSWDNPRIVAYIFDLNTCTNQQYSPAILPIKHYRKLWDFLVLYERINEFLLSAPQGWAEPVVKQFFQTYSWRDGTGHPSNRLKLKDWQALEKIVIQHYTPF